MRLRKSALLAAVLVLVVTEGIAQKSEKLEGIRREFDSALDGVYKKKTAQDRQFNALFWHFSFDGTDAELIGFSEMPGNFTDGERPRLLFAFECSRSWLRIEIRPSEFDERISRSGVALVINGFERVRFDRNSTSLIAVSTRGSPKAPLIRELSRLTREFFRETSIDIHLRSSVDSLNYKMMEAADPKLENRQAIAQFRERCATFWPDF